MRRVWVFAPLLLWLVFMGGCGGGGGTSVLSPFAGSWTDGSGANINVDSAGHVVGGGSGTLPDGTPANLTWEGKVVNNGALSGTVILTTATQTLNTTVGGGSNLTSNGQWSGTWVLMSNGRTVSVPFTLTRQ